MPTVLKIGSFRFPFYSGFTEVMRTTKSKGVKNKNEGEAHLQGKIYLC